MKNTINDILFRKSKFINIEENMEQEKQADVFDTFKSLLLTLFRFFLFTVIAYYIVNYLFDCFGINFKISFFEMVLIKILVNVIFK